MAEITLNLNKTEVTPPTDPRTYKVVTDQPGKHAELFHDDTLVISRGTGGVGWDSNDGITRVDFFHTEPKYNQRNATPDGSWTPTGTTGLEGKFTFSTTPATGGVITEVKVMDAERPSTDDPWWYKVTIGGLVLDPEVINKSGSGTSGFKTPSGMNPS
ncbi:MAG: hypothetical protein ACYTGG_08895 [Planctomycetota bacterium]|jgi:hypothetical protein